MPFLPSSGAISINDIKNLFGGPASPAMSNYYRGGAYIPSSKTVTVREPTSGDYYVPFYTYTWWVSGANAQTQLYWAGSLILNIFSMNSSYTVGGYTYYQSTFRGGDYYAATYGIYRTSLSTISINTGIPTSGTISLSQFYGAEKP